MAVNLQRTLQNKFNQPKGFRLLFEIFFQDFCFFLTQIFFNGKLKLEF